MATVQRLVVAAAVSTAALLAGTLIAPAGEASDPPAQPPNIVVITSDDQAMNSFRRTAMPRTIRHLRDNGVEFARSFATPPLCCPSRAGLLTGQYPHNHGVFRNAPGYADLREPGNVLPVWLGRAGYRTGFVGKYLNGTSDALGAAPPPGWDEWFGMVGLSHYFNPKVSDNGRLRQYHDRYLTPLLTSRAVRFTRAAANDDEPFFLWVSHFAPHGQGSAKSERCPNPSPQVRPRAYRRFADERLPNPPGFDERDVSDKPKHVRDLARLGDRELRSMRKRYRCTLAAMGVVDKGVAKVVNALKRAGVYDDTAVFFTSDNGFMLGEHRIRRGKSRMYEGSLRVPLVAHLPSSVVGSRPTTRTAEPVGGIDLAPTLLDLAGGAEPCAAPGTCRTMDGRSLLPLLGGGDSGWPDDRALLMEVGKRCRQRGLRTAGFSFSTRLEGCRRFDRELYDMRRDRFQLENVVGSRPGVKRDLLGRLDALLSCSGIAGRDPDPPGRAVACE